MNIHRISVVFVLIALNAVFSAILKSPNADG